MDMGGYAWVWVDMGGYEWIGLRIEGYYSLVLRYCSGKSRWMWILISQSCCIHVSFRDDFRLTCTYPLLEVLFVLSSIA